MPKRPNEPSPERLLVSRADAAKMLGDISHATLIRFERAGRLKAVKLSHTRLGKTFYRLRDIRALAEEVDDAPSNRLRNRERSGLDA